MMKVKKYLTAGGNSTALVWNCPSDTRTLVIQQLLREVEQVGFVSKLRGKPQLIMMGNELCVNATLALSYELGGSGLLYTSGAEKIVAFQNTTQTSLELEIKFKSLEDFVLFRGIGFILDSKKYLKSDLQSLCQHYELPAFGVIRLEENRIFPKVYVRKANSVCDETACGSGSIAINILTGLTEITQPTGEIIRVLRDRNRFTVAANVVRIGEYEN